MCLCRQLKQVPLDRPNDLRVRVSFWLEAISIDDSVIIELLNAGFKNNQKKKCVTDWIESELFVEAFLSRIFRSLLKSLRNIEGAGT